MPLLWLLIFATMGMAGGASFMPHGRGWLGAYKVQAQAKAWAVWLGNIQAWSTAYGQRLAVCPSTDQRHCAASWGAPWLLVMRDTDVWLRRKRPSTLCGSTWPAAQVVFQPLGGTLGLQGRWYFTPHAVGAASTSRVAERAFCQQQCRTQPCAEVVLTHTGYLRVTSAHGSLRDV